MLVRPSVTNLKMTVRADCAASTCSPLLLSVKAPAPLMASGGGGGGESAFGQMSALPSQLPASEIKETFLPTNLDCLLASVGFLGIEAGPHTYPFQ